MASKKKPAVRPIASFDELDAAGIGIGYRPMSLEDPVAADLPEQAPSRGLLRGAADLSLEAASGAAKGIKFMSDVFGADNPVSQGLQGVSDFAKELQSAQAKGEDQRIAQLMKEAEDKGIGEQVKAALRAAGEAPVRQAIGAIGTSVPMIAASMVPGLREASWGTRAAALGGMGGAQGVGVVKSSMYDAVYQRAIEEGRSEQEARALAQQAQAYSPENAGDIALGGVLGVGAALTGFEPAAARAVGGAAAKTAATKAAQRSLMQSTLRGTLAEAIPEATQGFQEQVAGNRAEQRAGFDTPTFRGAAGSATLEGLLSAPGGAVGGMLDARGAKPAPKALADQIRATESVPETGPMTRAANQAVEAKAQQVEMTAGAEGAALAAMEKQAQDDLKGLRDFAGRSPDVVAGMPVAGVQPAVPGAEPSAEIIDSPFLDRIQTVQEMLADPATREKVRARWGDEGLNNIAYYAGMANRTGLPEKTQDNLLGMAERLLSESVLTPIQPTPELGGMRRDPLTLGSQPQPATPALGVDGTPSGRFTVDPQGNVAPESRVQAMEAQRRAEEAASLGKQTPRGQAQPETTMQGTLGIGMDTAPTGRLLAGQDGVRPETRMDAINIGQADMQRQAEAAQRAEMGLTPDIKAVQQRNAMRPQDGDILNPSGKPFKTLMAAQRAAKKSPGEIVEVTGGFAIRPATMAAAQPEVANDGRGNQAAAGLAEALAGSNPEAGDRATAGASAVAPGEMLDALPGQPAGAQPAQGDAEQGQRVGREGYDTPVELDAASLKAIIEKTRGEPLATKPAKLEAWRNGTAKTDPAKYPIELAFTTDGRLDVNDGRHRIALAAERGEKVTAFIDGKDAQRAQELLANVQNLPQPASAQAPADQAPEAARGDGAAPTGVPGQGGASAAVEAAGVEARRKPLSQILAEQDADIQAATARHNETIGQLSRELERLNKGVDRVRNKTKRRDELNDLARDSRLTMESQVKSILERYRPIIESHPEEIERRAESRRKTQEMKAQMAEQRPAQQPSVAPANETQQTSTTPSRSDLAARAPLPKGDPEQAASEQAEMDGINALAGAAPAREVKQAQDETPFTHAGLKIKTQRIKVGDGVETRWVVQSPENAEREARGERQIGGDRIVDSREQAIQAAEEEVARDADDKARKAAIDAERKVQADAEEARKAANRGKTVAERRSSAILDKQTKLPTSLGLGNGSRRQAMENAVEQGRAIVSTKVRDDTAKRRDEAIVATAKRAGYMLGLSNENIPVVKAALEADKRLKANDYTKTEYRVYSGSDTTRDSFAEISKTEYDYAQELMAKQADQAPVETSEHKLVYSGSGAFVVEQKTASSPRYKFLVYVGPQKTLNEMAGAPYAYAATKEDGISMAEYQSAKKSVGSDDAKVAAQLKAGTYFKGFFDGPQGSGFATEKSAEIASKQRAKSGNGWSVDFVVDGPMPIPSAKGFGYEQRYVLKEYLAVAGGDQAQQEQVAQDDEVAEVTQDAKQAAKETQASDSLPDGWKSGINGFTKRPFYRKDQDGGLPFAVVQRTDIGYDVQIRQGDKLLNEQGMPGAAKFEALGKADELLAAQAVHKDPGQPTEAATQPVIQAAMKKAARNEDTKPSEMRRWLLGEIDKALQQAPDLADYDATVKRVGEKDAVSMFTGNGLLGKNSETGLITFDVPGDGTFKVRNSVRGLLEFKRKVEASPGFKDRGQDRVKPEEADSVRRGSGGLMSAITNMIDEGDFEAARDYAEAVGVKLEDVKAPKDEKRAKEWKAFLKDGVLSSEVRMREFDAAINLRMTEKPAADPAPQPAAQEAVPAGGFDSAAFDKARSEVIKASREAGNTHLDKVPAYVETMRGKAIFYVHDPKVRGIIRTVDNNQNVYVDWSDAYSAEKEMASPTQDGKKTVYRSTIGPRDLKDYALAPDVREQVATAEPAVAEQPKTATARPTKEETQSAMDAGLRAGTVSVEDFKKATGLTDEDTGPIGDGLREQADRIAQERSPYHQAVQEVRDALSKMMTFALDAASSTPQQRKSKEERIAKINRDRDTLEMIARKYEHPFDNNYVSRLSPLLRSRFKKRFDKIQTGFRARDAFNQDSYDAWAELLIEAANKKAGVKPAEGRAIADTRNDKPASDSLNKPHTIDKKRVLTPSGAISAGARNSDADSSIWYHQGDIKMLAMTASVKVDGQLSKGADEAKRIVKAVSTAQKAGWALRNYRAGTLGTVWTLEKGDQFLTRAGLENIDAEQIKDPQIPDYGPGWDNMVRGQKDLAKALFSWLSTLPAEQRENQATVSRKMADVLGGWAYIERDKLGLHVRYKPAEKPEGNRVSGAQWTHTIPIATDWSHALQIIAEMAEGSFDAKPAAEAATNAATSTTPATDAHNTIMSAVREGKATPEQFKDGFEAVVTGKAAIMAELDAKTKVQLLREGGPYMQMRYASEKKADVVEAMYRQMLGEYALGESVTFGMGKDSYQNAVRRLVDATDADKLARFVQEQKAAKQEAKARIAAKAAAIQNPQTLEDYREVVRSKVREGMTTKEAFLSLTPEQRIRFDTLAAESTRDEREARKRAMKTRVSAASQTTGGQVIATKHTRDGYDLFVVQLADRLSAEDYKTVLASAKKLGGWYSSFRGNGATPGFQFKDRASADAFLALAGGDKTAAQNQVEQRRDAFEDDRGQTAVERLRAMADKLEEQASEEEGRDRKANTARRARFASAALAAAAAEKAKAKTMRNIAQAIEDGKAKFLDEVRTKSQVDMLTSIVETAKANELRAKYPSYADQEKRKGEPPTAETADFADFPSFSAFRSDLAILGRQLLEVDGAKKLGQRLMSVADDVTDAYLEFAKGNLSKVSQFGRGDALADFGNQQEAERAIKRSGLTGKAIVLQVKRGQNRVILSPSEAIGRGIWAGDGDKRITLTVEFGNELVEAIGRRGNKSNRLTVPWQFQSAYDRRKALSRIGIETASEFRSALREFIDLKEQATANRVRELELQMVGRQKDGLDFFPTAAEVADQMVEAADLSPDMAVLEPSAGMGHLADRIREAGAEPDVIELSPDRRELLEEKGYHLAEVDDFMAMEPRKFFTYGDVFRAPDGTEGIMRGVGHMGSQRVRLEDEAGNRLGLYDRSDLVGVRHRGTWSGYDRIIMNPPFSNRRDAEHVRHAYDLLKPGGRIVAIMGEGVFFGQDQKAVDFRDWLESVGGTSEKLPEGSFMDPSLPVNTSVNARMVVIDKPQLPGGEVQFSRAPRSPNGLTATETQSIADAIAERWANAPEIVVAADMNDAAIPQAVRDYDAQQRSLGAKGDPEGFWYDGKVYLVAKSMASPSDVMRVLFHESLGHYGLRGVFGNALDPILNQIAALRRADVQAKADEYGLDLNKPGERLQAAEEVLSVMAQTKPELGYVKRAIAAIRSWMRRTFPKLFGQMKLTDAEIIRDYILPARGWVEGGPGGGPNGGLPAMSRSQDQTQTEAFKRWFGDSKVVDADGNPLVVYHGSGTDFDEFDPGRLGDNTGYGDAMVGFHFADNRADADHYASMAARKETGDDQASGVVRKFYLSLQNPLIIGMDESDGNAGDRTQEFLDDKNAAKSYAEENGHDGIIYLYGTNVDSGYTAIAFNPEQIKSATDNNGDFDPTNPNIRFSRTAAAKAYVAPAMDKLNETFNHPGKLSWWHKTVGSMYNLAERMPAFKPVYDAAQNFINDVSFYAIEAADKAPKLLPRLEDWKDLAKSPITAQDNKAVAAPVFEGTLSWRRDESGKPVLVEDLAKRYASLTPEQKAQRLLRANAISENVLKMWQGMPKDQYESSVNTAFEGRMLKAGITFTPDELKSLFKLNDAQVALYQEFRQSIDTSLDNMGKSDLLRVAGKDAADLKDAAMEAPDVDAAAVLLRDHLLDLAKIDPDRSDALVTTANDMIARAEKVQRLKLEGYAPLSRFGQYTVDVVVDGERQYFSMFETARDANRMAAKLKMEYGAENVAQGTLSQREFEMLQGITPESLELFGNMLGLDSTGNEAQDQVFQEYLKRTKANRSAMKRLIHRKGIAGYSEDVGRVLAAFVYSNARQTSAALHMGDLGEAVMAIPKGEGELKDAAVELARYVKEPREEAAKMRGWLFAQYLGGSIASAIVNFTQPLTTSAPYLSQFGGMGKSVKVLYQAMADLKDKKFEAGLAESFRKRTEDGTLAPQGVHELMAQSRGEATLRTGDGTQVGDALAKGRNTVAKVMIGWGKLFGMAEQINRQSTYVAAYRMAVERGMADPDAFAKKAVDETQFVNNKANKMKFGRGAIGATLMTFKSYSLNWLELFHRLATQNGREGKMAAAWMVGVLLLSAGASGLPFAEDAEDLADFLAQRLGYNWSSKKARQEFLESLFGRDIGGFVENGVTGLPGAPIDVSGRLGMGNMIPGTGLFLSKKDHTSDFTEVLGPAGDLAKRAFQAGDLLLSGNFGQAALMIAPKAIGNLEKGVDMAATGMYRDARGYKVDDATTGESIGKAIGFQPRAVAQIQEASGLNQRAKDFYRLKVERINAKWAKAIFEKDATTVDEVRAEIKEWNRQNPDQRIQANIPAILRRVKEMRKTKAERIADTAPKALRASMREEVRRMQEENR